MQVGRADSSSPYMWMCVQCASGLNIPLNVYAPCFRSQYGVECVCEMLSQLRYMNVICFLCDVNTLIYNAACYICDMPEVCVGCCMR